MVKLIVDSTSCIPQSYAQEHDIAVVQLSVELDNNRHSEGFKEAWGEYFTRLKNTKSFPKTSQPTPFEFEEAVKKVLKDNKDNEVIIVTISSSLSGTYNSATVAKQNLNNENVHVLDSGQTGHSMLLLIEELVELIKAGKTAKDIMDLADTLKSRVVIEFVPDTMEYLKRGGRINLLSATIAGILNIKPILSFKEGKLTNTKKCLGMPKAITELVTRVPKNLKKLYVIVIHESEWVQKLIDKVNQAFDLHITHAHGIGPVVGSHVGIGAIGLAYLTH